MSIIEVTTYNYYRGCKYEHDNSTVDGYLSEIKKNTINLNLVERTWKVETTFNIYTRSNDYSKGLFKRNKQVITEHKTDCTFYRNKMSSGEILITLEPLLRSTK